MTNVKRTGALVLCIVLVLALAVSAASALSLLTGDFDPADYERLYPEISVEQVDGTDAER